MKYNIFELPWPEPKQYNDLDIVWWEKGPEGETWFKAEAPNFGIIVQGGTKDKAVAKVIDELKEL